MEAATSGHDKLLNYHHSACEYVPRDGGYSRVSLGGLHGGGEFGDHRFQ